VRDLAEPLRRGPAATGLPMLTWTVSTRRCASARGHADAPIAEAKGSQSRCSA
jgi:hypothetical protein